MQWSHTAGIQNSLCIQFVLKQDDFSWMGDLSQLSTIPLGTIPLGTRKKQQLSG